MPSPLSGNIIPLTTTNLAVKDAVVTQNNVNANGNGTEYAIDSGTMSLTISVIGTGGLVGVTLATVSIQEFWVDTQSWETSTLKLLQAPAATLSLGVNATITRTRYEYIPPAGVSKIRTPVAGLILNARVTVSVIEKRHPGT